MLKIKINEDTQALEISCECAETSGEPADANKLSFAPQPSPSPAAPANEGAAPTSSDENSSTKTQFTFLTWRYLGYLIMEFMDGSCFIYSGGCFVFRSDTPEEAKVELKKLLKQENQPDPPTPPKSRPRL